MDDQYDIPAREGFIIDMARWWFTSF